MYVAAACTQTYTPRYGAMNGAMGDKLLAQYNYMRIKSGKRF